MATAMSQSQPIHKTKVFHDVEASMRDGTVLRADLYVPEGDGPFPTVVSRTPYDKSRPNMIPLYEGLAAAGYAVVPQDIRGRWASDGEFHPMFSEDWTDAEDGYDTVEWAAAQPWSNGKIGTFGYSYPAWTQWALAPTRPPHLVTMFTGGMSPRTTDWEIGGVFRPGRALQWTLGSMAPDTQRFLEEPHGPTTVAEYEHLQEHVNREKWLWFLPWKEFPMEAIGGLTERFHDWLANHHRDRWHFEDNFEKIDLPVFYLTGWYDRLVRTVDMFQGMQTKGATEEARRNQRLVVGPWTHTNDLARKTGAVDFGPGAEVVFDSLIIPWFDHWLKGENSGAMDSAPVRLFVMGANKWRDEEKWPLSRARPTDYYLRSGGNANTPAGDGSLDVQRPTDEPVDRYAYDPRDPVMTLYGANGHDEPHDQRVLDHRRDVLVYQTGPLERGIEVTGVPVLTMFASSTATDTDFTVKLIDVHPDGFSQDLCYSIVRARFRNGFDDPKLMTPGEVYRFEIDMLPTSNFFRLGHRIRVDISSSDYPNFDRNHNTGRDDWADAELRVANQTVLHDAAHPSCITLPVIPEA